jgi:hypothetical protein
MTSGWLLATLVLLLAVHHWRSQFYLVPWGRVSHWRRMHLGAGLAAVGLLTVHTAPLRPLNALELALLGWFGLCAVSGLLAWRWSRSTPRELTRMAGNQLFGSIPSDIARLRADADALVLQRVRVTGNRDLAVAYRRCLAPCLTLGNRCNKRTLRDLPADPVCSELAGLLERVRGLNRSYRKLTRLRILQLLHIATGYGLLAFLPLHILNH